MLKMGSRYCLIAYILSKMMFVNMQFIHSYEYDVFLGNEGYDCLKRIKTFPNLTLDTSFSPAIERQVLLEIYKYAGGPYWVNQSGWNDPASNNSHCAWYGITCHNKTEYVKSIMLSFNNLDGYIPNTLWKLRNLLSLCPGMNPKLKGNIGTFLFGNMSKLLTISLQGASFTGEIPADIVQLNFLQNLLASGMKGEGLSGPLPKDLGNMTELRLLSLGGNSFSGQLPSNLGRLKNLHYLDLANAPGRMWGYTQKVFSLPVIKRLFLSGVNLIGNMPKYLPNTTISLKLTGSNISGELPKTYSPALKRLYLANNKLTGDIPGSILQLLQVDLSHNLFSSFNKGKPLLFQNYTSNASYFSLAGNRNLKINIQSLMHAFSADCYKLLTHLTYFNLSYCDIESPLISNLFYGSTLSIDLRGNRFHGIIPDFFFDSSSLSYIDVSSNNLSGGLPGGIQSAEILQYLDISGNPLMRQGTGGTAEFWQPNLLRMTRPPRETNFTCPEGVLSLNNGLLRLDPIFYLMEYCICDLGFYGDHGLCRECMVGGMCNQLVAKIAKDLQPNIMVMQSGYWSSPNASYVTHLVKCPEASACNPSGHCSCILETSSNVTHPSSVVSSVSSLITSCNKSCLCHPGNTDRFCSLCEEGFYKSGALCFPCSKDNASFFVFLPVFVIVVLAFIWSFFYFKKQPSIAFSVVAIEFILMFLFTILELMPAWVFKFSLLIFVLCLTSKGKAYESLIGIMVFHIQIMDSMISTVDVWPKQVLEAQHYISTFWNLYFPSLSCSLPILFTPIGKFSFLLLLPVVCISFIGLYFVMVSIYYKFKPLSDIEDPQRKVRYRCYHLIMTCLKFTYFPIVESTFSVLRSCGRDGNILYMPDSPWILCTSNTYLILSVLGWLSVVFYVIGYPLLLLMPMFSFYKNRNSLNEEEKKIIKKMLYFDIVMLLRPLLLAISFSILSSFASVQTLIVWLILVVSLVLHLVYQPYEASNQRFNFENIFEALVLVVLSMSFMVLRFVALGSSYNNGFIIFIMIANASVLAALVVSISFLMFRHNPRISERRKSNCIEERRALLPPT